jgi:hypothetical protein
MRTNLFIEESLPTILCYLKMLNGLGLIKLPKTIFFFSIERNLTKILRNAIGDEFIEMNCG